MALCDVGMRQKGSEEHMDDLKDFHPESGTRVNELLMVFEAKPTQTKIDLVMVRTGIKLYAIKETDHQNIYGFGLLDIAVTNFLENPLIALFTLLFMLARTWTSCSPTSAGTSSTQSSGEPSGTSHGNSGNGLYSHEGHAPKMYLPAAPVSLYAM